MGEIIIPVGEGDGSEEVFGYIPTPPHPPVPEPPVVPGPPAPEPPAPPAPLPVPEPDLGEGLPDSGLLALLLVALGLAALAKALSDFFNWLTRKTLGRLWRSAGSPTLTPEDVAQPLTNAVGQQLAGVDAQLGVSFTKLAQLVTQAGSWIKTEAQLVWTLANRQAGVEGAVSAATARTNALSHSTAAAAATASAAATAAASAKTAAATAEQGLQGEIHALTTHITTVIEPELDQLRHAIPELHKGVATVWDEVTKHSEALGIAGLTAGVLTALGRVGAGWIECDSTSAVGTAICGTPANIWRKLLHGALDILGIAELCTMVGLIAEAGRNPVILDALGAFSSGVEDLAKCTGATMHGPLVAYHAALAPPAAWAALAPASV